LSASRLERVAIAVPQESQNLEDDTRNRRFGVVRPHTEPVTGSPIRYFQMLNQEITKKLRADSATVELSNEKTLALQGFPWHARRDSNPQPSDP
jgi:hypothetical protein